MDGNDANDDGNQGEDNKDTLHHELGFEDSMGAVGEDGETYDPSMLSQTVDEATAAAQAMPGSSGYQGVSNLCNFSSFWNFLVINTFQF